MALTLEKLGKHSLCAAQWQHIQTVAPKYYQDGNKLRHANALAEIGEYDAASVLLKEVDSQTSDGGEKSKIIEKIVVGTRTDIGQAETDHPKPKSQKKSNSMGQNGHAGKIVSKSEALSKEYSDLIKNTGSFSESLNFENLIIVTYGRTGSTLLQGILNTIDGMVLLGENDHSFYPLFEYEKKIRKLSGLKDTETPSSPFFGAGRLNVDQARKSVKDTIQSFFAPFREDENAKCFGFKEVKFAQNSKELVEYLSFLNEVFPSPAFVFLWRNHDDVLKSGWWKNEDIVQASDVLEKVEEQARIFAAENQNCFELFFEDITSNSPTLHALFDFLGASYVQATVDRVLQIPHSYNPESAEIQTLFDDAHITT